MAKLISTILPAVAGVKRAFHVFTPALQHRLEKGKESRLPVMALRSSLHGYTKMKLYERIEVLGPSSLEPLFDKPLAGTGGRGVAIMFTDHALRVWHFEDVPPAVIETPDGKDPKAILADVLDRYERLTF